MTDIGDWFECPECGESDNLSVKQVLGLGNFSVNLECKCGFRHVERDPSSDNWDSSIKFKQFITGQNMKAPSVGRVARKCTECPNCHSNNVRFWIYSDNPGLDNGKTVGHVRLDCESCSANTTTSVEHN